MLCHWMGSAQVLASCTCSSWLDPQVSYAYIYARMHSYIYVCSRYACGYVTTIEGESERRNMRKHYITSYVLACFQVIVFGMEANREARLCSFVSRTHSRQKVHWSRWLLALFFGWSRTHSVKKFMVRVVQS